MKCKINVQVKPYKSDFDPWAVSSAFTQVVFLADLEGWHGEQVILHEPASFYQYNTILHIHHYSSGSSQSFSRVKLPSSLAASVTLGQF